MGRALSFFLAREVSDNTPLIIDTGSHSVTQPIFRFENSWMLRESFKNFVSTIWDDHYECYNIEQWQQRLRTLRRKIRGWNKNVDDVYRKFKTGLLAQWDIIDRNAKV